MKILLISSSPHEKRSVTYSLAAKIAEGAKAAGAEVETVHLAGKKLQFCHACEACHRAHMTCHLKDDAHHIILKMLNADGLILAAPNYLNQVPAQLKTLMDRTSNLIHCQRLLGKYAAGAVTSGSGNNEPVASYLGDYARLCGAQYTGTAASGPVPVKKDLDAAFALGGRLASDIKEGAVYAQQAREIEQRRAYFAEIVKRRKSDWDGEFHYYSEKGWL